MPLTMTFLDLFPLIPPRDLYSYFFSHFLSLIRCFVVIIVKLFSSVIYWYHKYQRWIFVQPFLLRLLQSISVILYTFEISVTSIIVINKLGVSKVGILLLFLAVVYAREYKVQCGWIIVLGCSFMMDIMQALVLIMVYLQ